MRPMTRVTIGLLAIALGAVLTGCTSTTAKTRTTVASYQPVSDRLPSSSEYWFRRDIEDRSAVAKSISDGKGP